MADKPLHEKTFDEMVKEGVELELDAVVQGKPLKRRVWDVMNLAAQWGYERHSNKPSEPSLDTVLQRLRPYVSTDDVAIANVIELVCRIADRAHRAAGDRPHKTR
jgi:hypothetical protein